MLETKKETGLPIVTELTSLRYLDLYNDVDVIQVGARNMQNFEMLSELGHCDKCNVKKTVIPRANADQVEHLQSEKSKSV